MGFNTKQNIVTAEGGQGFLNTKKMELYRLITTSLLTGDSFYENQSDRVNRLRGLVSDVLKEREGLDFLSGLAVYTRDKMYLRTSPTILSTELFLHHCEDAEVVASYIWQRCDEFLEALSYIKVLGLKRPKKLLKAIAVKVNQLPIYNLIKYTSKGKNFSLRDALRLAHPTPKNEKYNAIFKYITKGDLDKDELELLPEVKKIKSGEGITWEQEISMNGSTKGNWEKIIPKMGYMALLRNLRNFIEKDISISSIEYVASILSDKTEVLKSRQLIWAFYNAYYALKETHYDKPKLIFEKALRLAMNHSAYNVPELHGDTLILIDVSGSMGTPVTINKKANVQGLPRSTVGAIMGAIVSQKSQGETWVFGTDCKPVITSKDIITQIEATKNNGVGHGTEMGKAFKTATRNLVKKFNRCIIFTDGQSADNLPSVIKSYKSLVPNFSTYIIDLAGYQVSCVPKKDGFYQLAGFSENVLNWISEEEAASDTIINHITELGKKVRAKTY